MENDWLLLAWLSPLIIVMVIFDLKARNYGKKVLHLPKKEYVSLLWLAILDPVFEVLFIGVVLWDDLSRDAWHWIAGGVGVVLGYFFARYRTRIMWVRPLRAKKAVILRNSGAEYVALVFLVIVKTVSENSNFSNYFASLLITVGLLTIVSESAFRVGILFKRYNKEMPTVSA
ncbi:MAG: hypothetical protein RI926_922 [Actinomycetota bacterium]|jgi:hypothetical protein